MFNPQKPGKTRVVFDCAAKFHNTSLNDQLLKGPDLTNNLVGVLLRFRKESIALMADIERMFHQVYVSPEDCNVLRFLWWPNGDLLQEPEDHQMLVHLFGATSSPSCASFALKKTAADNQNDFDVQTVDTVNTNFYVDDCLKSVAKIDEAIQLINQLTVLLSRGGFRLTKWICNNRKVMAAIPSREWNPTIVNMDLDDLPINRALGVQWNVENDTFSFRIVDHLKAETRRGILSYVSSMYDPLGLAAPLVLPIKILLQDLCRLEYGWDEQIPDERLIQLNKWMKNLPKLTDVALDRCIKPKDFGDLVCIQLHHFADASEVGYGAVSYLRLINARGKIHCAILIGKSRVAPLKTMTIPRLELTAATMAVNINKLILAEFMHPIDDVVYWTDSTIVLQYIRNRSKRFQTFVANRLAIIHDASSPSQWRHVDSLSNPADCASRGLNAEEFAKLDHWLRGPKFLWQDESHWPVQPDELPELEDSNRELKREKVQINAISQTNSLDDLCLRFSSWYQLQKAFAWLLRFKLYVQNRFGKPYSKKLSADSLDVDELKLATLEIIKIVQSQVFSRELRYLKEIKAKSTRDKIKQSPQTIISRNPSSSNRFTFEGYVSPLRKLNPVLIDGILCVGGRLEEASIEHDAKHPTILPSKHHVSDLIVRHYHELEGHMGASQVLAAIRQKFWLLRGPSTVKRTVSKCLVCQRWNSRRGDQIMAPLPMARVTSTEPPFTAVGIDYFGPILVKQKRSHVKRYGCVFTCLAIRAVHIEIAHDLSTDSFIQAFQRFVSRRGPPLEIYSDNGTNFKGAEADIKNALECWNQSRIQDQLRKRSIKWHFNPPGASHAGGIWERIIRSIRKIFRSLLGSQVVNDETLLTFMAEVEKILNDRPLTRQTEDPADLNPLTPSKLLLLRQNSSIPPGSFDENDKFGSRWRHAQYLADVFWRRWTKEYLPSLQERQKWLRPRRNLKVGDLVLITDENTPRGRWPKGIVECVFPDKYGIVRQGIIRTATTRLRRDVRKLCLLEGELETQQANNCLDIGQEH